MSEHVFLDATSVSKLASKKKQQELDLDHMKYENKVIVHTDLQPVRISSSLTKPQRLPCSVPVSADTPSLPHSFVEQSSF